MVKLALTLMLTVGYVFSQESYSELLTTDYNRDIAPALNGQAVQVNVSMVVISLKPDLNAQMVSIQLKLPPKLIEHAHPISVIQHRLLLLSQLEGLSSDGTGWQTDQFGPPLEGQAVAAGHPLPQSDHQHCSQIDSRESVFHHQ